MGPGNAAGRGQGSAEPPPELEAQIEARVRQERQAALQEGARTAEQRLRAAVDAEVQALGRGLAELAGYKDRLRREAERDLVSLAIEVARRLLHREITADTEALHGLVKAAMDKIEARELHRVRTHPQHARAIETALHTVGSPQRIEIVPDPSLEIGSVIIETSRGSYDASVTTQLREIERGFVDMVERRQ